MVFDLQKQMTTWDVFRPCDLSGLGPDYTFVKRVKSQFENGEKTCPCHPSCIEENYPVTVTSKTWPSSNYQVRKLGKTSTKNSSLQSTAAETYGIEGDPINNLIKVNVYYTSLNEKTTEDVIDYNIEVCGIEY